MTPLFDAYRRFYAQPARPAALARAFLRERLQHDESVVLIADLDGRSAGFTQLYPMFSSVRTARVWMLNDLFVDEDARRQGVAHALLDGRRRVRAKDGAVRLDAGNHARQRARAGAVPSRGLAAYDETPSLPACALA